MEADPREEARDRRARRVAGVAAVINTITALTGLVLGTCVLLLMWPYVLAGGGLLASFVLLITVGAAGQLIAAEAVWRHLQHDRAELGPPVLAAAIASGVIGIPALCWTPYLARFIAEGRPFFGYEWVAVAATAVLCIPACSGLAGLIAWWKYRRVYAAMAPVEPAAPGRFRRAATVGFGGGSVCLVLASWWWPGGPPAAPEGSVRGRSLAFWLTELQLRNDAAEAALAEAGRPAVEALAQRLAGGDGFRWAVADWMGELLDLGGAVAAPLQGVRVDRLEAQHLRKVAHALPDAERFWLPEVLAAHLPAMRDAEAREAAVSAMAYARADGVPFLLNVIDTAPDLRAAAAEALLWALPREGEPERHAAPEVRGELERRLADGLLADAAQCDLAGTLVRLSPPGEGRDRWIAWLREEWRARLAEGDTRRIGRILLGISRCGPAGAPLAPDLVAGPSLTTRYTVPLRTPPGSTATAVQNVYPLWTLRLLAPAHPAVEPGFRSVLSGTDHAAHYTALYYLAQPGSGDMAQRLRPQLLQVMGDGDPSCFSQAAGLLATLDGDITAALPGLQAQWKAAGANRYTLLWALRELGATAAPALPFLESQRGTSPLTEDELNRTIEAIQQAVRVERLTKPPEGK